MANSCLLDVRSQFLFSRVSQEAGRCVGGWCVEVWGGEDWKAEKGD